MYHDPILLLTGTIRPHFTNGIFRVNQTEYSRYREYRKCIKYYLRKANITRLVFAENSNSEFVKELEWEFRRIRKLEILHLPVEDENEVMGKGYGEGLLIDRVIFDSDLLNRYTGFTKITGRYRIHNIGRIQNIIRSSLSELEYDFIVPAVVNADVVIVPTYFFYSKVDFWREYLGECYKEVNDQNHKALESVIGKRIVDASRMGLNIGVLPIPPLLEKTDTATGHVSISFGKIIKGKIYTELAARLKIVPRIINIQECL